MELICLQVLADALERIINILALGQFVISTGLICFVGFQITSVRSLDLLASQGVVDKKIMWYSQSEGVGDSAYGSGWIGSGFCQSLQIIMMRTRVPNKITAAKFYDMSLESFLTVNKT